MDRRRVWADLALLSLAAGRGGTFVMVKDATQSQAMSMVEAIRKQLSRVKISACYNS